MQTEENPMANKQSFSNSTYAAETHRAERELSGSSVRVTELFGPEQARVSTEDLSLHTIHLSPKSLRRRCHV
jgi:hypothetical protein